jgi:hypothetical protein
LAKIDQQEKKIMVTPLNAGHLFVNLYAWSAACTHLTVRFCSNHQTRLSVAITVAVRSDDSGLHKSAAIRPDDAVSIVVRQVKMAGKPGFNARVLFHSIDKDVWIHRVIQPCTPIHNNLEGIRQPLLASCSVALAMHGDSGTDIVLHKASCNQVVTGVTQTSDHLQVKLCTHV